MQSQNVRKWGTPDSHFYAEISAGIPARIRQFTGRLQKHLVQCPTVLAPKDTVVVQAAGPLDMDSYRSGLACRCDLWRRCPRGPGANRNYVVIDNNSVVQLRI